MEVDRSVHARGAKPERAPLRERKELLVLGAALVFVLGAIFGGLASSQFFASPSPSVEVPLAQRLEEAHHLLDQGRLADAEKNYHEILNRAPGDPEALTHLGNIAFERGDLERALFYYEEALRREPAYAHALWDKGIALRAKGDDTGAIEAWEAFVRIFPPDSPDVIRVKNWINEAQARLRSGSAVLFR